MFNKLLLITFLLYSSFLFAQKEIGLDNNLTGIYSDSKSGSQFGLNFTGSNNISVNKLLLDLGTNYSLRFNPSLSENEFAQKVNVGYNKNKYDLFTTYQYNYSLVRGILADNWVGLGGGVKNKFDWGKISLSYAFIYENSKYEIKPTDETFRHSMRLKIKIEKNLIGFSTEYYYQPSINNFSDYIIYGSSKISLFQNKPFSLILQDVINYRSISDVKMIHNLSIGCSYRFSKKI